MGQEVRIILILVKTRTKLADSSLRFVVPRLINDTPHFIIDKIHTHSLQGFVFFIKQYFINLIMKIVP